MRIIFSVKELVCVFVVLLAAAGSAEAQQTAETKPKFNWFGDLRYRLSKGKESIDDERNYQQLRARLGLQAELDPELSVYLRLATGSSAISTNQTLGDSKDPGMPRRSFGLDMAYLNWAFSNEGRIWAGKTANPFWSPNKESLIFDPDISFEGTALKWEPQWSSSKAFFNFGGFVISENYDTAARQDVVDSGILGAQVGFSEKTEFGTGTIHSGYFNYLNIQDKEITSFQKDALPDPYSAPYDRYRGNIVYRPDPVARLYYFQDKFIIRSLGFEWKVDFDVIDFNPMSVALFYDSAENTEAGELNKASLYGVGIKSGRLQASWTWYEKQAESVVGAFTDSDVNGGGTDNKGTRLILSYQLSKYSQIFYSQYVAKRGIASVERDYLGSMLDVVVVF
jgi:hypothetical protein